MKKIAIIGKGIVGSTTAYYLNKLSKLHNIHITIFDNPKGQATKAAAGIISPWLSKRRNQQWYHLAVAGAELIPKLANTTNMPQNIYDQCGTIITRNNRDKLDELYNIGKNKIKTAPAMKEIKYISSNNVKTMIPMLSKSFPGILVKGGGRIDGASFSDYLLKQTPKNILDIKIAQVKMINDHQIKLGNQSFNFDQIVVAAGAEIKNTLKPLQILADIRPQKGQLIELSISGNYPDKDMPVLMPEGEYDFLPFKNNKVIIGATHEDNEGFNLKPTNDAKNKLLQSAQHLMDNINENNISGVRVGTRAYSSDYGPFFGPIPQHENILVGGALGSSGLTTGPMIGKLLAQQILSNYQLDFSYYEKPIEKYFK